ncbi:MAG TPA: NAD-dependent dehydratase [Candidatus Omnitrophica bacterium]|nr:MAG: hypothetical protein A3E74_04350 [Omnitrophica bacterium RIFCSPHIGHO2_12_FULL_44_12]HAH21835.1 NAD-dependent dehydratase [Candidatus Omnitrophota bacterium]
MTRDKILVTGGMGFIGSKLTERLSREGYSVVVLDNGFRGRPDLLKGLRRKVRLIKGDIRKKADVRRAAQGCRTIFHLAFINGTRYFYEKPELVLEVGVKGALNTLEVALESEIDKYILASSSEVYHQPDAFPTPETERLIIPDTKNPRFSYAGGKLISELLTLNYLRRGGITHCIFRPHNVFGPRMGFEHVIPELMQKLYIATQRWSKKRCKIKIQGSGKESRAFCYIDDAIEQIIGIFKKGRNGQIYNVGMNKEISIGQLLRDICQLLDIQAGIVPGDLKQGGTLRRCPDIAKVCSLGYRKNNHYKEGLRRTVEWYKENLFDGIYSYR